MRSKQVTRRAFGTSTLAAGIALPYLGSRRALARPGAVGANDRVRMAVIGAGGRARQLISESPQGVELVSIADCFLPKAPVLATFAAKRRPDLCPNADRVAVYQDYRRMFDEEKLDAVLVPTTTHARALCCIHALQAGLDVYAEKPISLTIDEGRVLIEAVRKYERILQVGTQHRSLDVNRWACALVRGGAIGKIEKVVCMNYEGPIDWTPKPGQPVPAGLDWDHWCNQAELRPYHPRLGAHRHGVGGEAWNFWRAYDGGGQSWGMTGWGTHAFDQVQWALGQDHTSPTEVWPVNPGDPLSPVTMKYASGDVIEIKLPIKTDKGPGLGGIFIGTDGKIEINRNKVASNPPELVADAPTPEIRQHDYRSSLAENHLQNWVDCIRSRQEPNCPVEVGHRQAVICHLANIARDLGRQLRYDPKADRFVDDEEANRHVSVSRPRRKGYELPPII
ncbi:MAG: Gfo/Idh/MocA family protein [Pirellulales bacterium]